jgi:glycosyltransferase involved in cell wall biosynthesis
MIKCKLVICSYAMYPEVASSEGIVNSNWFAIMKGNHNCYVISATQSISVNKLNGKLSYFQYYNSKLSYFAGLQSKGKLLFRILNKIFFLLTKKQLQHFLWEKVQSRALKRIIQNDEKVIVWTRILPLLSLKPVLNAYRATPFPIIININDPIESEGCSVGRINYFKRLIPYTQCWTFPSTALANRTISKFNLDTTRCFVLPHAMEKRKNLYNGKNYSTEKLRFFYTGTFYKSAFSENLKKALIKFLNTNDSVQVEFVFILSQFDEESVVWLKNSIRNLKILKNLKREEVLLELANADCVLTLDGPTHGDLLKGKVMEAVSFGLPILGVTYPKSVMEKVVLQYGGIIAYHNNEADIYEKLVYATESIVDATWRESFFAKRKFVMENASATVIQKHSSLIMDFAIKRFNNDIRQIAPPNIARWP